MKMGCTILDGLSLTLTHAAIASLAVVFNPILCMNIVYKYLTGNPSAPDTQREGDEVGEDEEDLYAPLGVNDEEYDTIFTSSSAVVIANRPPAPTPRPETTSVKEDSTPFIAQGRTRPMNTGLCSIGTKQEKTD